MDDAGNLLGPGEVGELVIRGPLVMKGYYKRPEETEEALRGGWLHTGDMGYRDDDGYFFMVDRKKEMVNVGGEKVFPREVEEVMYTHPAIAEAALVPQPDAKLGEVPVAVVALKPGATLSEGELVEFLTGQAGPLQGTAPRGDHGSAAAQPHRQDRQEGPGAHALRADRIIRGSALNIRHLFRIVGLRNSLRKR